MSKPDFTRARWRKSSFSNGAQACVELAFVPHEAWRKSSHSNGNQACVELAPLANMTAMRDSKNPASGALVLGNAAWNTLRSRIKSGEFDAPRA